MKTKRLCQIKKDEPMAAFPKGDKVSESEFGDSGIKEWMTMTIDEFGFNFIEDSMKEGDHYYIKRGKVWMEVIL